MSVSNEFVMFWRLQTLENLEFLQELNVLTTEQGLQ